MNITPVGNENAFKGLTILPAAKESMAKDIKYFYGGEKSLDTVYKKLEGAKINALEYLKIKPSEKTAKLSDINVVLHNVYVDKTWDTISYLYSVPDIAEGLFTLTTKDSVLKNPVEVFKQAMTKQDAALRFKYNL